MDFEDQEEEIELHQETEGVVSSASPIAVVAARSGGGGGGGSGGAVKYKECLKNHAVGIGGHAVDGCCEFMAAGKEGTLDALKCAACNCHRNFHRKEVAGEGFHHPQHILPPPSSSHHHHHHHPSGSHRLHVTPPAGGHFSSYSFRSPHPTGYLHVNPALPLALPSTSREDEDMSNPSSSGGGGGGGDRVSGGGSKKRFRTKFTQEQKDKMLTFAEKLGWRIQKQDEAAVQQFCAESNMRRHVLKVWMHNNKHTRGKKP